MLHTKAARLLELDNSSLRPKHQDEADDSQRHCCQSREDRKHYSCDEAAERIKEANRAWLTARPSSAVPEETIETIPDSAGKKCESKNRQRYYSTLPMSLGMEFFMVSSSHGEYQIRRLLATMI